MNKIKNVFLTILAIFTLSSELQAACNWKCKTATVISNKCSYNGGWTSSAHESRIWNGDIHCSNLNSTDIYDLHLQGVYGNLYLDGNYPNIERLTHELRFVGKTLRISNNPSITSIEFNSTLRTVGTFIVDNNPNLTKMTIPSVRKSEYVGYSSVKKTFYSKKIYTRHNPKLQHFYLNSLSQLERLSVYDNAKLTSISANLLTSVTDYIELKQNKLSNLKCLSKLTNTGGSLGLADNPLTTLSHLSNLVSVGNNLRIHGTNISSLNGLQKLRNIGGDAILSTNSNLTDISAFNTNLVFNKSLQLYNNVSLSDISRLGKVRNANNILLKGALYLQNTAITDYSQLDYLDRYTINAVTKIDKVIPGIKTNGDSASCKNSADIKDASNNFINSYTYMCNKAVMWVVNNKCTSTLAFDDFDINSGFFNKDINCYNANLTNSDIQNWKSLIYSKKLNLSHNNLTNVNGLSQLHTVNSSLYLNDNPLTSVTGLSRLRKVKGHFKMHRTQLSNVNGLQSLYSVSNENVIPSGSFTLSLNPNLNDISALNPNLIIGSELAFDGDTALTNISRIENMSIGEIAGSGGILRIDGTGVTNMSQIENAHTINAVRVSGVMPILADGDLPFCDNPDLKVFIVHTEKPKTNVCRRTIPELVNYKCGINLSTAKSKWNYSTGIYDASIDCYNKGINNYDMNSFWRLKKINGYLFLKNNNISSLEGLRNLRETKWSFQIQNNPITSLYGLRNLHTVGTYFSAYNLSNLTSLNGLGNLTSVGVDFSTSSANLTDINGLNSTLSIGRNMSLQNNPNLHNVSKLDTISVSGNLRLDQTNVTNSQQMKGYTPTDGTSVRFPTELLIKADYNSPLCSYVKTIHYKDNSDNSLLRTQVCKKDLRSVISEKCGVNLSDAYSNFNTITGKYTGAIRCDNKNITDSDLNTFSVLKNITSHLLLNKNNITNTMGLINLESIGNSFYLQENPNLTQLNLNSLTSIGYRFYLHTLPLLTSFDSLQNLTNITMDFSASSNSSLSDISALNPSLNIGTDLTLYNNYSLSDVSALDTITVNGGNIWLYNTAVTNAKQFENINIPNNTITMKVEGPMTTKASPTSNICRRVNPLTFYDDTGTVLKRTDICEEVFVDVLELKCNIPIAYTHFNDSTGVYTGNIYCYGKNLTTADIDTFNVLKQVSGYLNLDYNYIDNVDGLTNLKSTTGYLDIGNNDLIEITTALDTLLSVGGNLIMFGNSDLTKILLPALTNIDGGIHAGAGASLTTVVVNPSLKIKGNYISFQGASSLTDISSFNNIEFDGDFLHLTDSGIDNLRQIKDMKFNENSTFNIRVNSGKIRQRFAYAHKFCNSEFPTALINPLIIEDKTGTTLPLKQVCMPDYDKDEFVLFDMLENKCNMPLGVDISFEIDTKEFKEDINCASSGLVNSDVDVLRPIKSVLGSVYLNDNGLVTSSFGTANIANVDTLDYSNTNIVDLDISNYNTINTLNLSNNTSLSDIQGLKGVNIMNSIYINNTNILDLTSFEVVSFSNGSGSIYADNKTYSKRINQNFNICSNPSYVFRDAGGSALSKSIFCKDSETTAPFISSSTPANNANSVSILSNILISFSEKLYATNGLNLTELSSIFTITDKSGKNVDKQILFDNNSNFQILIAGGLKESETYTIKLNPNSVADESGNINSQQTIVFQTIDTESPYIIDQYPLANSVTMNPSSNIVLRFNEAITNYTSSFTLTDSNGVSVSLSYSLSGNDLTITHGSLSFNTLYTLQSIGGVIRDLAGNVISGQKFSFTTLKSDGSAGTIKERAGWNGVHREGLMFIKTSNSELKYALGWLKSHEVVTLDISKLTKYLNLIRANYTTSSGVQQSYLSALQTLSPADLEQFKALVK